MGDLSPFSIVIIAVGGLISLGCLVIILGRTYVNCHIMVVDRIQGRWRYDLENGVPPEISLTWGAA